MDRIKKELTRVQILQKLYPISGIDENNADTIFKKEFFKWRTINSDRLTVDGESISKLEYAALVLGSEVSPDNIKDLKIEYCGSQKGMALTEDVFRKEQISRYEPIFSYTEGKPQYRTENYRVGLYLKFLKGSIVDKFQKFEDLFYDVDKIDGAINILREVDPPLIDVDNNWIGKPLGAVCVWVDELRDQGLMKSADGNTLSKLIPTKIPRLNISESMFRKYHGRAKEAYEMPFKSMISELKNP